VNTYKDKKCSYYFTNPFKPDNDTETDSVLRNITFDSEVAFGDDRAVLINLDHAVIKNILNEINTSNLGQVSAIQISENKFVGIKGIWFLFELHISNNLGKEKYYSISVFMEDEEFNNSRISNYLDSTIVESLSVLSNTSSSFDLSAMEEKAYHFAQEKANDVYIATRLCWLEELEVFEKRSKDYLAIRRNAIGNIKVENIRLSKLCSLEKDIKAEEQKIKLERNIIPQLTLKQVAYVEFI